jgi:hypothetical protein
MTALDQFLAHISGKPKHERADLRYQFEERAGIAEDSGSTREEAEEIAWKEIEKL